MGPMVERNRVARPAESPWRQRIVLALVGLVALVLVYLFVRAVVPRWWAQRMANVIDGKLAFGSFVGFVIGLVFTLLPLIVLWIGWRWRRRWQWMVGVLVVAALAAAPNLATLGIVYGTGNAAHAGERTLDVDGPGFRGGSLIGAIVAFLLMGGIWYLAASRRRNQRQATRYRHELEDRA